MFNFLKAYIPCLLIIFLSWISFVLDRQEDRIAMGKKRCQKPYSLTPAELKSLSQSYFSLKCHFCDYLFSLALVSKLSFESKKKR